MHDWILTTLLTVFCYLVVDNFVVQLDFWKYLIIEVLLVGVRIFHMFAMKKLFPHTYNKTQGFL